MPGHPRKYQATEVGQVFAFGQLGVDLDVVDDDILRVLIDYALGPIGEIFRVVLGPPVFQVAVSVELAAFVVEAVGEFVADGAPGVAVVGRIVHLRVVQRRLQHAGGEVDVVHLSIEIGVDGGRRHAPLAAVERLADFR